VRIRITDRGQGAGQQQTIRLEAQNPVSLSLKEGRYEFTMDYRANIAPETIVAKVYNEGETTRAFTR
jgi:hypothetical protein